MATCCDNDVTYVVAFNISFNSVDIASCQKLFVTDVWEYVEVNEEDDDVDEEEEEEVAEEF